MSKLSLIEENGANSEAHNAERRIVGYYFDCPGCKMGHAPYIKPYKNTVGASWSFNGDIERPTFSPSLVTRVTFKDKPSLICHIFIRDGKIEYLSDCTHKLAGQTVEMEDVKE